MSQTSRFFMVRGALAPRAAERRRAQRNLAGVSLCASLLALACSGGGTGSSAPLEPSAAEPTPSDEPRDDESVPQEPALPSDPATTAPDDSAPEPSVEEPAQTPEPAATCTDSLSFDDLYAAISADLLQNDAEDAPFLRYVSLGHRLNQGICSADLDADRAALANALNSLSTESGIAIPEAIDEQRVIYRFDLRDLGWDQPATIGAVAFDDKWEAILATSPYAIEFQGDDAETAKLATQTTVPVLLLDTLIDATVVGDLYYALVGIGASGIDLFTQLGIDFADTPVRAGTSDSGMSTQDTIVQRFDTVQGFYWSRFDIADTTVGQSIFADPFGFGSDVAAALFQLPNGFLAFAIFDATFTAVPDTNVLVDPLQRDGRVHNSVSCRGCHAVGVNPITDQVRPYVESNPLQFDQQTFDDVQEQFLAQTELDEVVGRDNAAYRDALARAGVAGTATDGVSTIYQRFERPVTLDIAAGELGVTPDVLQRDLGTLIAEADPVLATLQTQSLQRVQFESTYLATLCVLLASRENRPLDEVCAAAE